MKGILTLAVVLISYVLFAGLLDLIEGPGEQEYREAMKGLRSNEGLGQQVGQLISRQLIGVQSSKVSIQQVGQLIRAAAEKKHPKACYILAVLEDKGSNSSSLRQCLEGVDGVEVFGNQAGYCLDRVSITGYSTKCDREEEYLRSVPKTVELYEIAAAGGVEQAKTEAESLRKRFSEFKRQAEDLRRSVQEERRMAREKREEERRQKEEERVKEEAERAKKEEEELKRKQEEMAAEQRVREEKGYTAHIDSFVGIKFGESMGADSFGNDRTEDGTLQCRKIKLTKPVCGLLDAIVYGGVKSGTVCKIRMEKTGSSKSSRELSRRFGEMVRKRYGVSSKEDIILRTGRWSVHGVEYGGDTTEYRLENGTITINVMVPDSEVFAYSEKSSCFVIEVRQDEAWNKAMAESRAEEDIDLL